MKNENKYYYDTSELNSYDFTCIKIPENYLFIRRIVELILIVAFSPLFIIIFLIFYILLKFDLKDDVFYTPFRPGLNDSRFKLYKFRTMSDNHSEDFHYRNDRISKFCLFVRKHRIDEIPQLLNILIGNMSLIGPRPEDVRYYSECLKTIPEYKYKFLIKPGLTGWAQVYYKHTDTLDEARQKLNHDYFYLKNISFKLDLIIFFRTFKVILFGYGAK